MGADTEMSGGVKFFAPKLRRESFSGAEYVLTGSGSDSFIGMAADMVEAAASLGQRKP